MPNIFGIDDDPSIRILVTDVLGLEGCDVRTAEAGFAGQRLIEKQRPDCVVLDVMMPGLDGHAVLQRIRAGEGGPDLPVVMLTAAADDARAWQAWTEGVAGTAAPAQRSTRAAPAQHPRSAARRARQPQLVRRTSWGAETASARGAARTSYGSGRAGRRGCRS